ncbi:MAG TPA: hypothetical protein VFQ53_26555 [Kofleriaceae bacterium]|nr:hypothetical protein [Kofleriaceae bacterium]
MSARAVLLLVLVGASVAHADPLDHRRIIGILQVEGPTNDITNTFERTLEKKLDAKTYWLVPRSKMRERMRMSTKWSEGCLVGACLTETKVQTGAEVVLLVALTGSGTSFGYVVTVMRTDTGGVLSQATDRCEVCTLNEAMGSATAATVKLINALPPQLPDADAAQRAEAEAAAAAALRPVELARKEDQRHAQRIGVTLTVVGLAMVVAGSAAYYLQDSRPGYGVAIAGGGTGFVLSGVAVLTF